MTSCSPIKVPLSVSGEVTRFGGEVDIRGRRGTLADSTLARGGPTLANLGLCSLCPDMPRHCPGEGTGLLPVCSPHPLGRATAARPHGAWRARLPARSPPRRLESRRRLWSLAPQQSPSGRCTSRAQPRPRVAPPSLAQYRRLDAVHMRQPHHRHHPRPLGAQKRARHVRVALGDERIVQRRYLGEMGVITRYD